MACLEAILQTVLGSPAGSLVSLAHSRARSESPVPVDRSRIEDLPSSHDRGGA